jgi:hypothetical protein
MSTSITTTSHGKRGRPSTRLALPHQRPRRVSLPFDDATPAPTPEFQDGLRRALQWWTCAAMECRPEDRLASFEQGLAALAERGLSPRDLLEAAK